MVIFAQFTLFLLIGVGLFVFYSTHPHSLQARTTTSFPTFIVQQMPHGVAGLLVAAILAAAMSNLSAALNSLASTTVIDFYAPFKVRQSCNAVILSERSESTDPASLDPATSAQAFQPQTLEPVSNANRISRLSTVFWAFVLFGIAVYSVHVPAARAT